MTQPVIRVRSSGPSRRAGLSLVPLGKWLVRELAEDPDAAARQLVLLVADPNIQVELGMLKPDGEYDWEPAPTEEELKAAFVDHVGSVMAQGDVGGGITAEHETLMRQLLEVNIRAVREGRLALPTIASLKAAIAHYDSLSLLSADDDIVRAIADAKANEVERVASILGAGSNTILPPVEPTLEREADPHTPESKGDAESVSTVSSTPGAGAAEETAAPVADGETIAEPEPDPDTASRPKGKAKR